jgi:hypothetical protein
VHPTKRKGEKTIFFMQVMMMKEHTRSKYFGVYTRKNSTIASGATPIVSAGVHPMQMKVSISKFQEASYYTYIRVNF